MEQIGKTQIEELRNEIKQTVKALNIEEKKTKVIQLESKAMEPDFWQDNLKAKDVMSGLSQLKEEIATSKNLEENISTLYEIFIESSEEEQLSLTPDFLEIKNKYEKFSILQFLNGKYDKGNAILSIHAGQGGTEANDWAEMLMRMYLRYCERMNWKTEIVHMVQGTEAGISTVLINIFGTFSFGKLKRESGTHRLVRLSPFNSQSLRQTSFAGVEVIPIIPEEDNEIIIKDEDIEFKAVRASGAGGQHVNKTSSAVQIVHIATGIAVQSSEQRDQFQNKKAALAILKAKLWQIEEDKREAEMARIKGVHKIAGWGNQIRNYVLHPYKLVKDLRTGVETSNAEGVLDGDLESFIDAEVRLK